MDDDGSGDARTFRVNFSSEGVANLREEVKEKLKEYMGEYTDDTLVEYVIVLLKNGRRKDEARNELNVFLDDDSDSFVSWLWEHLGSNLNLYVQTPVSHADEAPKSRPIIGEQTARDDSNQLESESEKVKQSKSSKYHHNREFKGLVRDEVERPPSQGYAFNSSHVEEIHDKVGDERPSVSPQPVVHRKRRWAEEREQNKRDVVSQATINAPRRLLQFAVRDAVATSRPSNSTVEPSLKRLRSVVSTSTEDLNTEERPHRIRSVARVPNAMATAIKAVAEAAKDVTKIRSSGNVFDRLGCSNDVSDDLNQLPEFRDDVADDGEDETYGNLRERARSTYDQRNDNSRAYSGSMSLSESGMRMATDLVSRDEDYDMRAFRQGIAGASQTGTSGGYKVDNSLTVPSRVTKNAEELVHKSGKKQDQSGATFNTSQKVISTSGNLNTWKSSQYQEARGGSDVDSRKVTQATEAVTPNSGVTLMKENNNPAASSNGNAKVEVGSQKVSQNMQMSVPAVGTNPISRPAEDPDSRTIFVNNVHFAATKDSLSRHFNKCGEVLKVIILIDAATGQPKGSAYVEFTRKESADNALSLDGTSFMSRILKVVKKSSAQPEASSVMTWPRVARASPFALSRFGRVPFPRGIPGAYRARLPIKPGARSMQWKRDAQPTTAEVPGPASANSIPPNTPRSLTYVRSEPKTDGSSSAN